MPNDNATLCRAADALYATYEAIAAVLRSEGHDPIATEARRRFMTSMRYLAIHACDADGQLAAPEATAISDIFWLDQLGWDNWKIRAELAEHPDRIEEAQANLEEFARLLNRHGDILDPPQGPDHNLVFATATLVFQTVLAADASADPEVERLTAITARLRQAAFPATVAKGAAAGGAVAKPADDASSDSLTSILNALHWLVGLGNVKQQVETLTNLARVFQIRREMGLPVPPMSFHLVFLGNPGTGKTTVARIIAQLYGKLGLLSKGQLIEVDRSGLVANYIGQTATKVDTVVEKAMGGVLFIDEAYALDGHDATDFGHEAVATLIKAMEDHRSDLVVIAAGYTDQMQGFLDLNPGIRSRIGRDLVFDDYTPPEMTAIFRSIAGQAGYALPEQADAILTSAFQRLWDARGKDFANARDVRNRFERVIEAQANRLCLLSRPTATDMTTITGEDLLAGLGMTGPDQPTIDLSIVTARPPAMSQLPPA